MIASPAVSNALGRHIALVGFMGAGKTTVGGQVARLLDRPFVDLDEEIERHSGSTIPELFDASGEAAFREIEADVAQELLTPSDPAVVALGGGAVLAERTRRNLAARAFTVLLDVEPDVAWERVSATERPLARDKAAFRTLHDERQAVYEAVADARAQDAEGIVLAAAGVHVQRGSLDFLDTLVPGRGSVELVADGNVLGIHGVTAQLGLDGRNVAVHEVPAGEGAKSVSVLERLWRGFRIGRDGTIVALGGGCTTDVAGFAASAYMRGVAWVAVPTTLVGQVDAAIGGKTAIDLPGAKNIVGAFHWPARVIADPAVLETLPQAERENGMAEAVKTSLLAGERWWELRDHELVRHCAAYKASLCLRDPYDRGPRAQLNLGHTFGHALEAAAGYELPHGRAVALGMVAALRLSGNDEAVRIVEQVLAPQRVRCDRDAAWAALGRDKKASGGRPRFVLLERLGEPRWGVELPERDVRAALDALITE